MVIVKYKTCKSSKEFEEWQKNEVPKIISIAPLYKDFFAEKQNADVSISISDDMSVFVTYINEIEEMEK